MVFDLHVHSRISPCSHLGISTLLEAARRRGLDGVCITDHESTRAVELISEGVQSDGLVVLVGREYATEQGDFLVYGPGRDAPAGLGPQELLEHVSAAGGAVVPAHPFREGRPTDTRWLRAPHFRTLEGVNGRCTPQENRRALNWAAAQGMAVVGGSDAHSSEEVGGAVTVFGGKVESSRDLVAALNSGDFQALCPESGPVGTVQRTIETVPASDGQLP